MAIRLASRSSSAEAAATDASAAAAVAAADAAPRPSTVTGVLGTETSTKDRSVAGVAPHCTRAPRPIRRIESPVRVSAVSASRPASAPGIGRVGTGHGGGDALELAGGEQRADRTAADQRRGVGVAEHARGVVVGEQDLGVGEDQAALQAVVDQRAVVDRHGRRARGHLAGVRRRREHGAAEQADVDAAHLPLLARGEHGGAHDHRVTGSPFGRLAERDRRDVGLARVDRATVERHLLAGRPGWAGDRNRSCR